MENVFLLARTLYENKDKRVSEYLIGIILRILLA